MFVRINGDSTTLIDSAIAHPTTHKRVATRVSQSQMHGILRARPRRVGTGEESTRKNHDDLPWLDDGKLGWYGFVPIMFSRQNVWNHPVAERDIDVKFAQLGDSACIPWFVLILAALTTHVLTLNRVSILHFHCELRVLAKHPVEFLEICG